MFRNSVLRNSVLRSLFPFICFSWTSEEAQRKHNSLLQENAERGATSVPWAPNPGKVPAANFVGTLAVNVDNEKLSDAAFREFVRNTLPIVEGADVGLAKKSI